jgi:sialate O-acetylesterase
MGQKRVQFYSIIFILTLFISSCSYKKKLTADNVELAPYYSSGMVFQRNKPIMLRGRCTHNGLLAVRIESAMKLVEADADGNWEVDFPPVDYKDPFTIYIEGADEEIKLENVVTGKVWIVIGDGWLGNDWENVYKEIQEVNVVGQVRYCQPVVDLSGIKLKKGAWKTLNSGKIKKNEQFPRILGEELFHYSNTPVGLVNLTIPGTNFIDFAENIPEQYSAPEGIALDSAWMKYYDLKEKEQKIADSSFNGIERGVLNLRYDDSDWGKIDFPIIAGNKRFLKDKIIWFRKKFFVADKYKTGAFKIDFGTIRGGFIFYLNGDKVGEVEGEHRHYSLIVPDSQIRTWGNLITIRMVTSDSLSGFFSTDMNVRNEDSTYKTGINENWAYRTYYEPQIPVAKCPEWLYPRVKEGILHQIEVRETEGVIVAGGYPMFKHCNRRNIETGLELFKNYFHPQKRILFLLDRPAYTDSLKYNNIYIQKVEEQLEAAAATGYSIINISDISGKDGKFNAYEEIVERLICELN